MMVRLALGAHSKLVGAALDRGFPLGEALFKQHMRLQVRGGAKVLVGFGSGVGEAVFLRSVAVVCLYHFCIWMVIPALNLGSDTCLSVQKASKMG